MPVTADEVRARISTDVAEAMDRHGLTLDNLIKQLKRELKAKETKFFQKDGKVVEKHNVIAWDVRQRARIDAHKLRGDYPAEKREIMGDVDIVIRDCVKEAGDGD